MRARASGLQRTCAKDGRRKKEERGNTRRTILGKGYSGREGECEAKPGRETRVTKAEEGLPRSARRDSCPTACPHP